jgi:pimeloyl-ACP methyl ester carboxylesterase
LVYVAAFALDQGESFADIFARFGATPLVKSVQRSNYPLSNRQTPVELTIRPGLYQSAFAADVPSDETDVLAVSQRPFAAIFDDSPGCRWKKLPSWAIVATSDNAIPPDAERHMAQRAGAKKIVEVDASHSIALSQPAAVAELIRTAVEATSVIPSPA